MSDKSLLKILLSWCTWHKLLISTTNYSCTTDISIFYFKIWQYGNMAVGQYITVKDILYISDVIYE